jgi:hypothetical protein
MVLDFSPINELEAAMTHGNHDFTNTFHWLNSIAVPAARFKCGFCSVDVGSGTGWVTEGNYAVIRLCPQCNGPSFFTFGGVQWPGAKSGSPVANLPLDVGVIHEEARNCIAANAPSGAAMLCRKILMHVAVEKGAEENQSFQKYVQWLITERYAPKGAEDWLDYIRTKANDANHEIMVMTAPDAIAVLLFTEALLRNVYELPSLVPSATPPEEHSDESE